MKRLSLLSSCLFLLLGLVACQPPAAITAPDRLSFPANGDGQTFSVTVNRDWRIVSSESWCTVTPQSGPSSDAPVSVKVNCQPNPSYDERKAVLTIQTDEITHSIQVVQAQKDAILSDAALLRADFQAQDLVIPAEANVDFTVSVLKGDDWIKPGQTKGLVKKEVTLHLEENRSGAVREGSVQLSKGPASFTLLVRQAPWHAVLEGTVPGLYGMKGKDYVYEPGVSQLAAGKIAQASFFRILHPDPPRVISVEGLPAATTLTDTFPLNVRLVSGEEGVLYQTNGNAAVLRESDSLAWLLLSDGTGLIIQK